MEPFSKMHIKFPYVFHEILKFIMYWNEYIYLPVGYIFFLPHILNFYINLSSNIRKKSGRFARFQIKVCHSFCRKIYRNIKRKKLKLFTKTRGEWMLKRAQIWAWSVTITMGKRNHMASIWRQQRPKSAIILRTKTWRRSEWKIESKSSRNFNIAQWI